MCGDVKIDENGSGKDEVAEGKELQVRVGATELVCSDEFREMSVFAITNETWLTRWRGRAGWKKRVERDNEDAILEGGVGLEPSMDIIVSW